MKQILPLLLIAALAVSCASKKQMYADPFEEEEVEMVVTEKVVTPVKTSTTQGQSKPVVAREEKVTMTHGESLKPYQVIVGSFSNPDNAIRLRNTLLQKGYTSIIMKNEAGMNRVSIAGFDQETPARAELWRVRENHPDFADAWLLVTK